MRTRTTKQLAAQRRELRATYEAYRVLLTATQDSAAYMRIRGVMLGLRVTMREVTTEIHYALADKANIPRDKHPGVRRALMSLGDAKYRYAQHQRGVQPTKQAGF